MSDEQREPVTRRAVTARLQRYFSFLTEQLSAGTAEFWNRIERRTSHKPTSDDSASAAHRGVMHAGVMHASMQQQPVQQQQAKAGPEKKR
jgi:hypothetical protein